MTALAAPAITSRYVPAASGGADRAIRVSGWSHGLVGAVVAAWPAVSLVGSYELSRMDHPDRSNRRAGPWASWRNRPPR